LYIPIFKVFDSCMHFAKLYSAKLRKVRLS
jgi:hypothetical protein